MNGGKLSTIQALFKTFTFYQKILLVISCFHITRCAHWIFLLLSIWDPILIHNYTYYQFHSIRLEIKKCKWPSEFHLSFFIILFWIKISLSVLHFTSFQLTCHCFQNPMNQHPFHASLQMLPHLPLVREGGVQSILLILLHPKQDRLVHWLLRIHNHQLLPLYHINGCMLNVEVDNVHFVIYKC